MITAFEGIKGGQAGMARLLGVRPQAVNQWAKGQRPIPARHVLAVEAATGVSRHELRPDVFGSAESVPPAAPARAEPIVQTRRALIDSRMSKRALREKVGAQTDRHLAMVLGLSAEEVESWPDEGSVPAVPAVVKLLGLDEAKEPAQENDDPDADRIAPIEVA